MLKYSLIILPSALLLLTISYSISDESNIQTVDTTEMKSLRSVTLSLDNTVDAMEKIKFEVTDSNIVRFFSFVEVTPEIWANQLVIDAPTQANASNAIKIKITAGGNVIEGAYIVIDSSEIGQTDKDGVLNYTLPITMKGNYNITATKLGYEKARKMLQVLEYVDNKLDIQCLPNESLIKYNIIIVIDASGSTSASVYGKPIINQPGDTIGWTYENSVIGLIDANAIDIVRNIEGNSMVGLVAFGGFIKKMELRYMGNDTNRKEFEKWIQNISPKGDNPTDLDKGLHEAEKLLNSVDGTKEVIVISDGLMPRESFEQIKNKTIDLKNKEIKIHFVQVLTSNYGPKEPNKLYNELAKVFNESVIVLTPHERISTFIEIAPSKESPSEKQCSARVNDTITITVTSGSGNQIESAEVSFDNTIIGKTNSSGKLDYALTRSGLYNITATKLGYEKAMKTIQILPTPTISPSPTVTINQTLSPESLSTPSIQSKETSTEIKKIPGFEGVFAFLLLFILIAFRLIF